MCTAINRCFPAFITTNAQLLESQILKSAQIWEFIRSPRKKSYFASCRSASNDSRQAKGRKKKKPQIKDSIYENPIDELKKYVEEPEMIKAEETSFRPTRGIMEASERLFTDLGNRGVYRLASARTPDECPHTALPEIAMLGYSNVGKSSLIKALFHRCPRLRVSTSSTPGHTKTVDFFQVHDGFVLVDMPGYGLNQPESFATTVGAYLNRRQNLRCAFLLFNPEQGIKPEDQIVIKKLESLQIGMFHKLCD